MEGRGSGGLAGDAHRPMLACVARYVSVWAAADRAGNGAHLLPRRTRQTGGEAPLLPGPARQAWRGRPSSPPSLPPAPGASACPDSWRRAIPCAAPPDPAWKVASALGGRSRRQGETRRLNVLLLFWSRETGRKRETEANSLVFLFDLVQQLHHAQCGRAPPVPRTSLLVSLSPSSSPCRAPDQHGMLRW